VPETAVWTEQPIANGLNGIPVNSGYKIHTWNFENMEACDFGDLMTLFASQQDGNSQLVEFETEDFSADLSREVYSTVVYTDFVILNVSPRTRGLPLFESVAVVFEVFIS
jgi:hypothetical protein